MNRISEERLVTLKAHAESNWDRTEQSDMLRETFSALLEAYAEVERLRGLLANCLEDWRSDIGVVRDYSDHERSVARIAELTRLTSKPVDTQSSNQFPPEG